MKKTIAALLFVFMGVCLYAQTLTWDIKFFNSKTRESFPISKIITMETGQYFSISLEPDSNCFSYIILYDSNKKISVLYDAPLTKGEKVNLGRAKLEEPSGTETLYVIMSLSRQTKLESLIQSYKNDPDSRSFANNLYREIITLQNAASKLGEPASAFIPSGGTTRGTSQEYATRFSGKEMYVRTISIRH